MNAPCGSRVMARLGKDRVQLASEPHGNMRKSKHRGTGRVAANFSLNLIAGKLIRIPN